MSYRSVVRGSECDTTDVMLLKENKEERRQWAVAARFKATNI